MSEEQSVDIYRLVSDAIANVFKFEKKATFSKEFADKLMGDGFFNKIWMVTDFEAGDLDYISQAEIARLRHLAGPNGYALWKAWKVQKEETND